jgi:predicted transcriptional regulator
MGTVLTVRLSPGLQSRLDSFSDSRHISRSAVVKAALVRYLEEAKQYAEISEFAEQIRLGSIPRKSPDMEFLTSWTEKDKQNVYRVLQRKIAKIRP